MSSWVVIALRSLSAVVFLFAMTRVLGKKQISQLTFFEYVLGITLGDLAGFISTDIEAHFFHGVVAMLVWFIIPLLFEYLALHSRKLRGFLEGKGRVMIKNGKILERNLRKERFSADELLVELHKQNVFNFDEVEYAVLEPSGDMNVLLKKENRPLTLKMLGIHAPDESEPHVVIMDGKVIDKGLAASGYDKEWLYRQLHKRKLTIQDVFLAQVDALGKFHADAYDDGVRVEKTESERLLTLLQKCSADVQLHALSAKSPEDKEQYVYTAKELEQVIRKLSPMLKP